MNYEIDKDEVILYKGNVWYEEEGEKNSRANFVLTSKKMIFEITNIISKGLFKREEQKETKIINLNDIKIYNGEVQCKQKSDQIMIQSKDKDFSITLDGIIEAKKVIIKIIDATTNTSMVKRGSNKVKSALDIVDDTLGFDTRGVVRGVVENGLKGTIINGIKKKK